VTFLVLLLCLKAQPKVCVNELLHYPLPTVLDCILAGPDTSAGFVQEHRGWTLKAWGCMTPWGAGKDRNA